MLKGENYKKYILIPLTILGCISWLFLTYRGDMVTTNEYCMEYIRSGKMERYEEIRREQHRILSDETIKDATVPEMVIEYPILHMPLSENPEASRNRDRALYYNKESVKAVMVE